MDQALWELLIRTFLHFAGILPEGQAVRRITLSRLLLFDSAAPHAPYVKTATLIEPRFQKHKGMKL